MRIVTIGAGGFVGGWICEELTTRGDIEQVACVRKWASAVRLARRGIAIRQADLENLEDLEAIVTGADAVVNATMPSAEREAKLVTALYSACVRGGVRRFVQFSSTEIYGNRTGTVDESAAAAPDNNYGRGKVEMESRLIEAATAGTQLVILRPSVIYGPFCEGWIVRYVQRIGKGRWRGLGRAGRGLANLVHAQDVARMVIAAATADIPAGIHVLNINGPDVVTWNEYVERLGNLLGEADRVIPNSARFRFMATAAEVLRLCGKPNWVRSLYRKSKGATRTVMLRAKAVTALYPCSSELHLLSRKARYVADRADRTLGISPSIPLEQGLRQSVDWCRVHGVV